MAIGVSKIASIAAIESILRRLNHLRPGFASSGHDLIDLCPIRNIMLKRESGWRHRLLGEPCVMRDSVLRPDRQLQPVGEVEKGNGTMGKFPTDDACSGKA